MAVPDLHRPATDEVLHELRRVGDLLERLVALAEERRDGERAMEELGAMLARGDSQAGEMSDQELVDAHFRMIDGRYWINTDTAVRLATPDEAQRLDQLVGRRRQR